MTIFVRFFANRTNDRDLIYLVITFTIIMAEWIEFWDLLGDKGYIFAAVVFFFCCHIFYVIFRSLVILSKNKEKTAESEQGVSLIITSNNKADYLKENLEAFLTQDYSKFEVIVVDDCSEDDTQDILVRFQQQYPNLRITRIFPDTKFRCTKKLAINIGVLAANYDVLLFSEIDCVPVSPNWIRTMQAHFDPKTAVVLGYANYTTDNKSNRIWRYFRFLRFLKLMMLVRSGCHVMGEGCNMAYRKAFYLEKRGYSRNSQIYMGYDSEMVKELSQKGKVKIVKEKEAYVWIKNDRRKVWMEDYAYYYTGKREWSFLTIIKSEIDVIIRFFFYVLSFYLIFSCILYKYMILFILLTFLMDFVMINVYMRHLGQRKLFITSFVVTTIGFAYRCYYDVYSIFTSKKWR